MATYTAPTTRTTGALISASIWNTDIVENLKYFKDAPVFDGAVKVTGALTPNTNDGSALGSATVSWADLFLASGGVINFANGDVTITHSSNTLAFAGGTNYTFDAGGTFGPVQIKQVSAFLSNSPDALLGWAGGFSGYTDGTLILQPRSSAGTPIVFATGSTTASERVRITSGGDVAIGATAKLYLDGVAGTGDTYIYEGAANDIYIFTGGAHRAGFNSAGLYIQTYPTTANAANLWSANGSNIHISTSSLRYKHDITTLDTTDALSAVMAMRPVTYRGKTDEDQRRFIGFIAEEMQAIAPLLCTYDEGGESGTPNYVTYDRVTAYLVAVVQQQQQKIAALEARIH